jgi:glycyl-tRNA synthetase
MVEVSGHAWRTDYDLRKHTIHSGVDLRVFVKHEKSRIEKKVEIIPNKKTLGQSFKETAQIVSRLLEFVPAEKLKAALEKDGFFDLGDDGKTYRILSTHVQIKEVEVNETGRRFIANVVEPSFGLDRIFYATLEYSCVEKDGRTILKIPKTISPFDAVVFPLVSKDGLSERAQSIADDLMNSGYNVEYDDSGSIGHRYARADEIGIPLAVTVDYDTMKDSTVTLRDRDTWEQIRVPSEKLTFLFDSYFRRNSSFAELSSI